MPATNDQGFVQRMQEMIVICHTAEFKRSAPRIVRNTVLSTMVGSIALAHLIIFLVQAPLSLAPLIVFGCAMILTHAACKVLTNRSSTKVERDLETVDDYLNTHTFSQNDSALLEQLAHFVARGNTRAIASHLKRAKERSGLQDSPLLTFVSEAFPS